MAGEAGAEAAARPHRRTRAAISPSGPGQAVSIEIASLVELQFALGVWTGWAAVPALRRLATDAD